MCFEPKSVWIMSISSFGSLPNLISLLRLVLVPVIISMIVSGRWVGAFLIFVAAGISDAVDGWLANRFNLRTELGAYLDPLADKMLLISIYVALALSNTVPATIAILIVFRDLMIIAAFLVSWILGKPIKVRPLFVSKANTMAQIAFAALVLGAKAFGLNLGLWFDASLWIVAALTLASAGAYLWQWIKHMGL
jgi:cardiolipin synthase